MGAAVAIMAEPLGGRVMAFHPSRDCRRRSSEPASQSILIAPLCLNDEESSGLDGVFAQTGQHLDRASGG
jgi:hypothetical protein